MRDQEIAAAFQNKILGVRLYKSDKKEFVVADFVDIDVLKVFLTEVSTGESDITPAGKMFLDKCYGFEDLAVEIALDGGCALVRELSTQKEILATQEEILEWLKSLEPMQTITFIEEARGNIKPGARLRADLLPPDDA